MCWPGGRADRYCAPPRLSLKLLLRYHSQAILASLRRGLALEVWCDLRQSPPEPLQGGLPSRSSYWTLERALAALDMFVIHDDVGDMDTVCAQGIPTILLC